MRIQLLQRVAEKRDLLISATRALVVAASPNPPGDTKEVAKVARQLLEQIPGAQVSVHEPVPGVVNVVARISTGRPGKTVVFSGHLDTYPLCEHLNWTVDPIGGDLKDGRIYGRGSSDMKAGIAASIGAATALTQAEEDLLGEIVIALAGDEENMGYNGSQWLLDNVPGVKGDVMICGDVGSPSVIRFGEKGFCWFEIDAVGAPAHGAHVHKGINAIDRLRKALDAVKLLEDLPMSADFDVSQTIAQASSISEPLSGQGETQVLQRVTVNIGCINGGTLRNLVPSEARAEGDIRIPIGISTRHILDHLSKHLDPIEGITWRVIRKFEPTYTPPSHVLVRSALSASGLVLGDKQKTVANMRVGASDSRLFRRAGVPSVVVGCTPHNMGGADEYIEIDDLVQVAQIHALIAQDFLQQEKRLQNVESK